VSVSSLFAAVVDQPVMAGLPPDVVPADLLTALASVPDPRARRGVRHRCRTVLGVAVCAVLAGARSYLGIAEWAQDLTPTVRMRLGVGRAVPCEATLRRLLQGVDAAVLDRVVSTWLASRVRTGGPAGAPRRVVAIDGKTARGARQLDGRAVHLLAAFDTGTGTVLGQTVVDGKTNEINAFAPLADRLDLSGVLITADALHTQRGHVGYLRCRGAHYLLTVKANQPTLLAQLTALPWAQVPVADVTVDKGHGRLEERLVKLTTVAAGIGFPDAALAVQITRRRKPLAGRRWQTETVHAITDLQFEQTSPAELADAARAHWGIENRLHWIRDVTFAEDLSQIRTGHGPAVMATLRNLAISLHRLAGATSIATACRTVGRHPNRVLPLLT